MKFKIGKLINEINDDLRTYQLIGLDENVALKCWLNVNGCLPWTVRERLSNESGGKGKIKEICYFGVIKWGHVPVTCKVKYLLDNQLTDFVKW